MQKRDTEILRGVDIDSTVCPNHKDMATKSDLRGEISRMIWIIGILVTIGMAALGFATAYAASADTVSSHEYRLQRVESTLDSMMPMLHEIRDAVKGKN